MMSLAERDVLRLKRYPVLFWAALLISGVVKLSRLNSRELWLDETYSAHVAQQSLPNVIRASTGDLHPPLYHLLLHLWILLAGSAQTHLRLFSVLLSLACTVCVFLLAKRALGQTFGALASALFAFSPIMFVYSLEVRSYMLLVLLTTLALDLHWRVVVEGRRSPSLLVCFGLVLALLFYVHYLSLFVLLAVLAHAVFVGFRTRDRVVPITVSAAVALLLMLPGLHLLNVQRVHLANQRLTIETAQQNPRALLYHVVGIGQRESDTKRSQEWRSAAVLMGFFPVGRPAVLILLALPLLVLALSIPYLAVARSDTPSRLLLLLSLTLALGLIAFGAYGTRCLLLLTPMLALALARALQVLTERRQTLGIAVGCLVLAVYGAGFARQATLTHGRPWENAIAVLQQNYQPGEQIVFDAGYSQVPFDYFATRQHFQPVEAGFPEPIYVWWTQQHDVTGWGGPVILRQDLDRYVASLLASPRTSWIISYEPLYSDPNNELVGGLQASGRLTEMSLPPDPDAREAGPALHLFRLAPTFPTVDTRDIAGNRKPYLSLPTSPAVPQ